jgi:hypothetical protein
LSEWDDKKQEYTGRIVGANITYILDDPNYCKEGYVIIGFEFGARCMVYRKDYSK